MCSHCSVQGHPTCCLLFSVLKAQTDHLRAHKEHQTNTRKRNFKVQQHSSNFPMIIFMLKGKPCPKLSFFCSVCLQVLPVCLSGSCVLLSGGMNTDKLGWLRILSLVGLASGNLARQRTLTARLVFPMINNLFLCFWLKFNKKMFQQGKDLLKAGEERSTFAPRKTNPFISLLSQVPCLSGRGWLSSETGSLPAEGFLFTPLSSPEGI